MNYWIKALFRILSILSVMIFIGCGNNTTYYEADVYSENYIFYDKKTNKPISGELIRKGKSGKIRSEWQYKNGRVDGKTKNFYQSGKMQAEGNFKDGKKHGKQTIYHADGKIYELSNYIDGKLDGEYVENLPTGKPKRRAIYKLGKLERETDYSYYKNGIARRESTFSHGRLISKKLYHKNGKIKEELINTPEKKEQLKKEFSFEGVLNRETKIIDRKLDVVIYYTFDGKLSHESYCTENDSILRKDYSPSGELISEKLVLPKKSFYSQFNISCNKPVTLK